MIRDDYLYPPPARGWRADCFIGLCGFALGVFSTIVLLAVLA